MLSNYLGPNVPNAAELMQKFNASSPFPHVVIDDFLKPDLFNKVLDESKSYNEQIKKYGRKYSSIVNHQKWSSQGLTLTSTLTEVGQFFGSKEFLSFAQEITGIKNLSSIVDFNSDSLGFFSVMSKNSFLGPHIDHMYDMTGEAGYHVLNIILYITDSWDPNWGGATFLRNRSSGEYSSVEFKPNRALLFLHSPLSEHGTTRISKAASNDRMSIYFDFYSARKDCLDHFNLNIKLTKSPHLFFLPRYRDYLYLKNFKYLRFQLKHCFENFKIFFK